MSRKLKFDLDIDASALLQANSEAFYSRAYLNEEVVDNYRTLPGVKYKTKISNVVFGQVLQEENCGWNASTDDLASVEIDVCGLSAMAQICQFDLEQSFVSLQMTKGSNGDFTVASFMDYYWNEMSKTIAENVEKLRWSGDTNSGTAALALCDGYKKGLVADSANVIEVGGATPPAITAANVLEKLALVYAAIPAAVIANQEELRLYVSSAVATSYRAAVAASNTQANLTQALDFTYLGIKMVLCPGMLGLSTIVASPRSNFIYAFDAEGDGKALRAINLADTIAEPVIRTRANMKVGFTHVNGNEIVFYNSAS
jgi:hypothetical protein